MIETLGGLRVRWAGGPTFVPADEREIRLLEALLVAPDFRVLASSVGEVALANVISALRKGIGTSADGRQPLYFSDGWLGLEAWSGPRVDALEFEGAARVLLATHAESKSSTADSASASRMADAATLVLAWNGEYLPASHEAASVGRRAELAALRTRLLAFALSRERDGDALARSAFEATPHDPGVAALLVSRLAARGEHRPAAVVRNQYARARHARAFARSASVSTLPAFLRETSSRVGIADRETFVARAVGATGASAAYVLRGGWGAGKTRTLADLARAAEAAGWRVGFYAAQSTDRDVPPATIHFRLAAALAADGEVERYRATIEDIVSGDRPAMLVIDDAHHLDDEALASLLGIVAENAGRSAPVFVASTKTERLGALCASSASFRTLETKFARLAVPSVADIERIVCAHFGGSVAPRVVRAIADLWPGNLHAIASAVEHTSSMGIVGKTDRGFDFVGDTGPAASRLVSASFCFAIEAKLGALETTARGLIRAMAFAGDGATAAELESVLGTDRSAISVALDALHDAEFIDAWGAESIQLPAVVSSIATAGISAERAAHFRERFAELRTLPSA